ncbi:anti-sigma-I factor RsgI6-like [Gigantopelta aegis]|uniref:anti-sigma-I factor RsgI6-like n=1 Tax=Gigantopelta aegis TaxID=1735272 RepID=UPI001B88E4FD|nr:anti-sigma-I factor RsgI6-like [Gigantopelta aegis]
MPIAKDWNWRHESDANINKFRKSNIVITVHTHGSVDLNQVEVEIKQTKKSFPFGTAISSNEYYHGDTRYQNFVNQHFNWAVSESWLKWHMMEPHRGHINYDTPIRAIKKLRQHGIKVRGHNIIWSATKYVQDWVKALSGNELKKAVHDRITGVVAKTKDLVEHWDVNNENLHNFYYQNKLHDINYNLDVFRQAHQAAPNVKMFLNEYDVVAGGGTTEAYLTQALKFKHANVGLYGLGVQSHFNHQAPDPALVKSHLDTLAQAGLPIWVTELDFHINDEHTRADAYEMALRLFYGHPAVEGIMLWGFWSEHRWGGKTSALVSGQEFRINPAGQKVLHLFEKEWMTHETHRLSQSGKHFTVRAFHGDYEVHVRYRGREVTDQRQTFTLGKSAHTINLHVSH